MEEKRHDAAVMPPTTADSPASEPASSRRRAGSQKRKANALNASNSSSTPSKRITREKAWPAHPPPFHNGPLTRARQIPNSLSAATASPPAAGSVSDSAPAAVKPSEHAVLTGAFGGESVPLAEGFNKESQWEALEAAIEAQFEAIRFRGANAHVVPNHCGWFSWTDIHPIEKHILPSFFNGKTENRTPDTYMEIRNWIVKKFHTNPNVRIELKDLSELNAGDLDARQEVMEFMDYWGLINFHPFPSTGSTVASANDDGAAEKNSLLEKLYHFETLQFPPVVPKTSLMTPATTSGLFPESVIADELVKEEGPSVEYHCNSCSADCSRKRYHCQKQADFDLCTDCFSNGKFGSGMSSLDFILMEPAEVPGFSGGKWTDQETLLLLEALELYKENWNEIAEHVATKSKAQCILHFVQMPIEDAFVDCGDDVGASCKETADPAAANIDPSVQKDATEFIEKKTSDNNKDGHELTLHNETSEAEDVNKVNINQDTPKLEHVSDENICEGTSKSEDGGQVKSGQEAGNNCALNALKEAFAAVGYSLGPEGPSSFAEVGNPIMALAVFLARLVGSDLAVASSHSSLKSMSVNSPSSELAARHCFLLEDPPDDKDPTSSDRESKKKEDWDDENVKQDKLDDKESKDHNDKKIDRNVLEVERQLATPDNGASGKPSDLKEQAIFYHEEVGLDNCNDPCNSKLPNDQAPSTVHDLDGSTPKAKIPPCSEKLGEKTSVEEPYHPVEDLEDRHVVSDSLPLEKNELQQSKSNLEEEQQFVEITKDAEAPSDSMPLDKSRPQKLQSINPVGETLENSAMDVDMVSNFLPPEKNESHSLISSISSQHAGMEKDFDMMSSSVSLHKKELSHPVKLNSGTENGSNTGENLSENGRKDDGTKTKHDKNFDKVKHAAVSTLAAAAVKAKLLANQEEDQLRQLASLLIEKQLLKLETKLAFFNDMENVVMRLREHLDRSRQKLYHERALIIASRFGLPVSSSRGVSPSLPINRIPMSSANSVPITQFIMNSQRPPISRPVATIANSPYASTTASGNSVRPSSQEKPFSVGTK